ncbi:alpha/beta fold hydrolase [Streptomyces sp. SID6139]|uniref:alpha/beta fold hydrolase n=1 Tax=Streptomyces sp. SID6139 TaxID=2690320 RepID=UPI00136CD10C|nr:alpha/beta fold hydrolase [Streptomyces sp. SID6139]
MALAASAGASVAAQNQPSVYATSAHRPIIFIHGWHSDGAVWGGMKSYAETQGYKASELHVYDYSGMTNNPGILEISSRLAGEVDEIAKTSPDGKVDIVAHSMGGLVARAYIKEFGGLNKVKHFVSMGTPNHGTIVANIGSGASNLATVTSQVLGNNFFGGTAKNLAEKCDRQCHDMASTSGFLQELNSGNEAPQGADGYPKYTTFRSNVGDEAAFYINGNNHFGTTGLCDGVVFGITRQGGVAWEGDGPNVRGGETSELQGADNIVTPCLSHDGYYNDAWTQEKALDALTEPGDKYAPARGFTKCNELSRATGPGGWTQGWMQSCLETDKFHTVTPVIRVRGCGHYRATIRTAWKSVWYYVPEGEKSTECNVNNLSATFKWPGGSNWITIDGKSTAYMSPNRAFEVKLANYRQTRPGRYSLENPQVGFYIWGWNDGDNYARCENGGNVELDNTGLVPA